MLAWLAIAHAVPTVDVVVSGPEALFARAVPVTIAWEGPPARVEAQIGGRWRPVARRAASPWEGAVPPGAPLRLVHDGGVSVPVGGTLVVPPRAIAAAAGSGLPGARVVDLKQRDGVLWAATLDGGAAAWDGAVWTPLPSPHARVVELDPTPHGAWLATAAGLVGPERVVTDTDGLPDPYVQTVAVRDDTVWVGTYRGLARVDGDRVETVLAPWSCFSLVDGPDGRLWVGYEGLRGLPDGEPIEGVPEDARVFDTAWLPGGGVWLADAERGVQFLYEGILHDVWAPKQGSAVALARRDDRVFVAAMEDGLWAIADRDAIQVEGLPRDVVVNEVIEGPGHKLWVGTDRGVLLHDPRHAVTTALPMSPLPAGVGVRGVAPTDKGAAVASADGLVWLGRRPPRGWRSLVASIGPDARAVARSRFGWWAANADAFFHLDPRGEVHRWPAEATPVEIVPGPVAVWLRTADDVRPWAPGASQLGRPLPATPRGAVDPSGVVWTIRGDRVRVTGRDAVVVRGAADVAPAVTGAWIVGRGGLSRVVGADVTTFPAPPGPLHHVALDPAGAVWTASDVGVVWTPSHARIDLGAHLPDLRVVDLIADAEGAWVATDLGLFRIYGR